MHKIQSISLIIYLSLATFHFLRLINIQRFLEAEVNVTPVLLINELRPNLSGYKDPCYALINGVVIYLLSDLSSKIK